MESIAPIIRFDYRGVSIKIHGECQDSPPKMARINYEIVVDTDENDRKLALMHDNIRKFGAIYNNIAIACELTGSLRRVS